MKIDSMMSLKTDIVSSSPTNDPPTVNPSSIHVPRIVSIIYFSPTASFALKELYHTHNAAVKETPPAAFAGGGAFALRLKINLKI